MENNDTNNSKIYYSLIRNFCNIMKIISEFPLKQEQIIKINKDIVDLLQIKEFKNSKRYKDISFIIEILCISTSYHYICMYFYYIYNTYIGLDVNYINNSFNFNGISQIFIIPHIEEIESFNIEVFRQLKPEEFAKQRAFSKEMVEKMEKEEEFNIIITEMLKQGVTVAGYFTFLIHDLALLNFTRYVQLLDFSWKAVFFDDNTLAKQIRYYIGIMAASYTKSYYTLRVMEIYFIDNEGDEQWLIEGLKATPVKIQIISGFLNKLASSCWSISKDDICYLKQSQHWSIKELIEVSSIFCYIQRISNISESIGLSNKIYDSKFLSYITISSKDIHIKDEKESDKIMKLENLKKNLEDINTQQTKMSKSKSPNKSNKNSSKEIDYFDEFSQEAFTKKVKLDGHKSDNRIVLLQNSNIDDIFSIYIDSVNKKYKDFDQRTFDYESYLDFNWNDQAIHILKEIVPKMINVLHDETEFAFEMTSNTLGDAFKHIDTKQIRLAIWCYIEKIYGLERETYDYHIVNKLLDKDSKTFIKYSVCFPEQLDKSILTQLAFTKDEIIHIILLANASRFRTQMTLFTNRLYEVLNND